MEPEDASQLHAWENASEDWWMGASVSPISAEAMKRFAIGNHDLYHDRQLRLMLDARGQHDGQANWRTVGAVDLYDFEPRHLRAGVALHVDHNARRLGHGLEGLLLLADYARQHLGLRQLYAEVPASHHASLALFTKAGYLETGRRLSWIRDAQGGWDDVVTLQMQLPNQD
jgi:diamine N-acetyltransferase